MAAETNGVKGIQTETVGILMVPGMDPYQGKSSHYLWVLCKTLIHEHNPQAHSKNDGTKFLAMPCGFKK